MQRKRTSGEDSLRKTHGRSGVNQDFSDIPEEIFRILFEQVLKIVAVIEAVFQSNIRDGTVGGKKRRLGVFEPYIV